MTITVFTSVSKPTRTQSNRLLPFGDSIFQGATSVALFSGGMDSLAGVIEDVVGGKNKPLLVSHWPEPRLRARQARLVEQVEQRASCKLPHVQALVQLINVGHPEPTQRSRSFLYLSLAAAVAKQFGIRTVRVYENGVVGLNLPIWKQCVGGMDTRTTHPKFLSSFQELARRVLNFDLVVENPFFFKTRAEVAEVLRMHGCSDLIGASTSCSRIMHMSEARPQCGVCSQCIDRRVSLYAKNLADHDTEYENDVLLEDFTSLEKKKGWKTANARAMALGYVRAASNIAQMSQEEFLEQYPETYDAIPYLGLPDEEAFTRIVDLQSRQAQMVLNALGNLVQENAPGIVAGTVSRDSLVGIIAAQEHLKDDIAAYATRLADILSEGLPMAFQTRVPKDESEVQDVGQAVLNAAGEKLDREFPQLSYAAVVGTKADFTSKDQRLFVEFKYPRPGSRTPNKIAGEMNGKILEYTRNDANVLFIVYDHHRLIPDRTGFSAEFTQQARVFLRIIV
jgi:7-cyano-7-deazaguanine synthase in queuosine biosynthesis